MSLWVERILDKFPSELARLWIASDPDDVLLDEQILSALTARGFEILPFEDPISFRTEYEERYRQAWDHDESGTADALVLHLRSADPHRLPWDYLHQARMVHMSLAHLFPRLSYGVVRQMPAEHLGKLFEAHAKHAPQALGEAATKDFILTHIFRISPHLIAQPEDLWRELLRLHHRDAALPPVLAEHVDQILSLDEAFKGLPIRALFSSKATLLRLVQDAWYRYLNAQGITGSRIAESRPPDHAPRIELEIPFDHPDIRALIGLMFLDGTLHPLAVQQMPGNLPDWIGAGIVKDPAALRNLVRDGLQKLNEGMPAADATHRDWGAFARRFGEILARFHSLDGARAQSLKNALKQVQQQSDEHLQAWVDKHYGNLPSLPAATAPVMVHHIPRYLALRRNHGEAKVALLVFDGLAVDQWVQIREQLAKRAPTLAFEEDACFAWIPTLTSVSRQALFSGLKPREFADSIDTTSREPALWSRFWQDQGLRAGEIFYRKSIRHANQLDELATGLSNPVVKVAGIVVDTIDEIVHGAVLGKRGIASQIESWCDSGFVERLFALVLEHGFHLYLTADHGNVDAIGVGRPQQGVIAETRGERVRVYRSDAFRTESAQKYPGTVRLEIPALPGDFLPLFAAGRTAFSNHGEELVAHGGVSVEELIVPFVKVSDIR